jgi:hypothetical protein
MSHGFRPKRSATQAMERVRKGFIEGYTFEAEFDIRNLFNEIDHERLIELVGRRVSDRRELSVVLCRTQRQAQGPRLSLPRPYVGAVVGAAAGALLLPASLALAPRHGCDRYGP